MAIIKCLIMSHYTYFPTVWQESQGALGKLPRVNNALHSTLSNIGGQTVMKIWMKFKLPHWQNSESPLQLYYGVRLLPHFQIRIHSKRVMTAFEDNPKPLSLPWSVSLPAPGEGVFISSPNISRLACL